jgi:hypothetical protein
MPRTWRLHFSVYPAFADEPVVSRQICPVARFECRPLYATLFSRKTNVGFSYVDAEGELCGISGDGVN